MTDGLIDNNEGEFARWPEHGRRFDSAAVIEAEQARHRIDDGGLDGDQGSRQPQDQRRLADHGGDFKTRPYRDEEQAEQQTFKGFDHVLDFAAVFGFGQQHAGDEGTQPHAQTGHDRYLSGDQHTQQTGRHEQFARPGKGDGVEQRTQQPAAADDQYADADQGRNQSQQAAEAGSAFA